MVAKLSSYWRHDGRVYWHSLRLQIRAAMSLRGAFTLEILGMILNNIAILIAWFFLFHQFGTINGWGVSELIGFEGLNMITFGIMMVLSVGVIDLPRHVDRGSLDTLLTKPQPVLLQLASSNVDATVFGDLILGVVLTSWYALSSHLTLAKLALFVLALLAGLIIFWCLVIALPSLLAFYVFDSERLAQSVGRGHI